ncbi:hypothetical protein RN001_015578 [Aquatica leii]|uniref:Uncharacterized protein n=1 Tax=Aquatica leii TaxID=1421715 RepID=A0AAN7NZC8_9COLE|nr:hypothetical protein RN001_015578 [Aquatica leii]
MKNPNRTMLQLKESKDAFCDDVISILISDDEDSSDVELTGTNFIPTVGLESDEKLKNDTVNKEVLPLTEDTVEAANYDNTIQSLDQDQKETPTNKFLDENVTKFDSIIEKPLINNDSKDLPMNIEQPRLDESSVMIHEKTIAEFISDSSTNSSDHLESTVNNNGLVEDVDFHEDISVAVNVQLENAIQDTQTTSKCFRQNDTLEPQTETSLSEMQYQARLQQFISGKYTYSPSQNLAQEEIVEVDTMLSQEENSTLSEHLVDEATRGNSPNADSGVFDVFPVAVLEESLTPSYSYELTSESQFQNNENGATDCIVRSGEVVEVHPDIENYVDENIIELQTTVQVNDLNSTTN